MTMNLRGHQWLVSEIVQEQGGYHPSVLGTHEATSRVLHSVLNPSLRERHQGLEYVHRRATKL